MGMICKTHFKSDFLNAETSGLQQPFCLQTHPLVYEFRSRNFQVSFTEDVQIISRNMQFLRIKSHKLLFLKILIDQHIELCQPWIGLIDLEFCKSI